LKVAKITGETKRDRYKPRERDGRKFLPSKPQIITRSSRKSGCGEQSPVKEEKRCGKWEKRDGSGWKSAEAVELLTRKILQ